MIYLILLPILTIYVVGVMLFPTFVWKYDGLARYVRKPVFNNSTPRKELLFCTFLWPFITYAYLITKAFRYVSDKIVTEAGSDWDGKPVPEDNFGLPPINDEEIPAPPESTEAFQIVPEWVKPGMVYNGTYIGWQHEHGPTGDYNMVIEEPDELSHPKWAHRSGRAWVLGDYRTAMSSLKKQVEELAVIIDDLIEQNGLTVGRP